MISSLFLRKSPGLRLERNHWEILRAFFGERPLHSKLVYHAFQPFHVSCYPPIGMAMQALNGLRLLQSLVTTECYLIDRRAASKPRHAKGTNSSACGISQADVECFAALRHLSSPH